MPKTRQKKQDEVQSLTKKMTGSKAIVFTTQRGVSVHDMQTLRRDLKKNDAELTSIKKTLLGLVLKDNKIDADLAVFDGNVGLTFSYNDEVSAAKIINAFSKKNEGMKIVGGILENKVIGPETIVTLASLPGRQELLATLVRTMQSPVSGLVRVLSGSIGQFVRVLDAIKDSK